MRDKIKNFVNQMNRSLNNIACVAIILPFSDKRFLTYARFYAVNLLKKGRKVVLLSPDYLEINEFIQTKYARYTKNFFAIGLDPAGFSEDKPGVLDTLG